MPPTRRIPVSPVAGRGVEPVDVPEPPRRYSRELPPISQASAEQEPPADRVFPPDVPIADERAQPPAPAPAPTPATKPTITLSTQVEHRGRLITITATDMTADAFCDLLDRRGFQAPALTRQWQTLPDGTPICPKHNTPMRMREKQGDSWWSHNVGSKEQPCYCRGYKGKDSPGYDQ